jgi:hypothetical protein
VAPNGYLITGTINGIYRSTQPITSVDEETGYRLTQYYLFQNYPNPFNPSTRIMYALPSESRVSVKVYSVLGQEVRALVNDVENAGFYHSMWDGRDNNGMQVSSGVYFFRMVAQSVDGKAQPFAQVKKMLLMK